MQELKITMLGPSGVGKTSLLTAMCEQFNDNIGLTNLQLIPDIESSQKIQDCLAQLTSLVSKTNFQAEGGTRGTKNPSTFVFDIGETGVKPSLRLHFQDYPGGWIESKATPDEIKSVENSLRESAAVLIPIDAAALMEREGRWHEKINRPTTIANLFQRSYQQLNSPRLVILAPVKCETYMKRQESEDQLLSSVREKYTRLIDFFKASALLPNVAVVVTPVQTVGNVIYSRIEGEDEDEPIFYFRQIRRNLSYAPTDSEQPLRYLLRFLLKLHIEQKRFPGINFIRNLAGLDAPFRLAATEVAKGCKNTGGFAVLQGQQWLNI